MAINATSLFEVQSGGSDNNAGGFDPSLTANMLTDGAATSATGTAPVFSSASYNFVAGDVGAWVFIASGTNWTPGWYKISAVASNKATLDATSGHAVLYSGGVPSGTSTGNGCAMVASPSGATWAIDYSQQGAAQSSYSNLATTNGTTLTSTGASWGKQMIGNSFQIRSGGTNFAPGWYFITGVTNATTLTLDRDCRNTAGSASSGVANLGGALATPGKAGAAHAGGNILFIQSGSYSITSVSANVVSGCLSLAAGVTANTTRVVGYGTYRLDYGTQPTLTASGISSFKLITLPSGGNVKIENLALNGASLTGSTGVDGSVSSTANGIVYKVNAQNFVSNAFKGFAGLLCVLCESTGHSGAAAYLGVSAFGCTALSGTSGGFNPGQTGCILQWCIASNNSGGTSHGFASNSSGGITISNCTSYNNGGDGFRFNATAGICLMQNCIAENNAGWGFGSTATCSGLTLLLCGGYNNSSGLVNNNVGQQIGTIIGTGTAFTNAAGNDFSLNNNAGGGATFRAAGLPGSASPYLLPGLSTNSYEDCGAVQHQAVSSSSGGPYVSIG